MAQPQLKCDQIPALLSYINAASRSLDKIRAQMDELGFGTAAQLMLLTKLYNFMTTVGGQSGPVLSTTVKFVACNDAALANLNAEQLKGLLSVLQAHADLVIAGIPSGKDQTPDQAALLKAFQAWQQALNAVAQNSVMASADKLRGLLSEAKKTTNANSPLVQQQLVQVFGDELAKQIANGAITDYTDRKTLLKKLAEKVVISALGKAAASKVIPYIDVALTGWELIVEVAGASAMADVREYINQQLVVLIKLMKGCGWRWTQNPGKNQKGDTYYGFQTATDRYIGATVVARAYIRCGKLVDGKPVFSAPCAVMFTTGTLSITTVLAANEQINGKWNTNAQIDMKSVEKSPCIAGANFCYAFLQLTYTFADKTTMSLNLITGVQTFE